MHSKTLPATCARFHFRAIERLLRELQSERAEMDARHETHRADERKQHKKQVAKSSAVLRFRLVLAILAVCVFQAIIFGLAGNGVLPMIVPWAYCALSCTVFMLYGSDKLRAKWDYSRIPEVELHIFEMAGGWPGALVAQHCFNHKRVKLSYQIEYWTVVILHLSALVLLCGLWRDWPRSLPAYRPLYFQIAFGLFVTVVVIWAIIRHTTWGQVLDNLIKTICGGCLLAIGVFFLGTILKNILQLSPAGTAILATVVLFLYAGSRFLDAQPQGAEDDP